MVYRVIVNGAQGKMGRLAAETLDQHSSFELVAALGRGDNLQQYIRDTEADIVVELTTAACVYENSLTIINNHAHPVIGASGLSSLQIEKLQVLCKQQALGGIIVPNFSIGALLMMRFATMAARFFNDVEIVETHHPQKIDAPSGTAMKTAVMIEAARTGQPTCSPSKNLIEGARGALYHQVPIHALRLPGMLARQDVIFGQLGETLSISHHTLDRASFMPGMIQACEKVPHLCQLYYGLEQVLEI